jgi:Holliday junction resolvase RusA-like endonuclease
MRPQASTRARVRKGQGGYRTEAVTEAMAHVQLLHNRYRGAYPKGTPVCMELTFLVVRWRGDVDNLAKLVMDALKASGVYHDDRQVKQLRVEEWPVASKAAEGVQLRMHQVRPTTTEVPTP